jgi:hypothetical protein
MDDASAGSSSQRIIAWTRAFSAGAPPAAAASGAHDDGSTC